jgi:DMSO/TMAO reductase YedYZ heme-binding membrane subunit/nitrite reductase/ring-hydroxylating ferredoxin subunit
MSARYVAVKWNRNKRLYDGMLLAGISIYLTLFIGIGKIAWRGEQAIGDEVLFLRALGSCALLLLHVVLCIGPLARLDRRFLPALYNRRHLGVATFLVALTHAALAVGYYHGFGALNPLVSLLTSNTQYGSLTAFPFEALGLGALAVLFLMAATSHDFWQKNLSPGVWKSLHMLVYPAYALVVLHVALGALLAGRGPTPAVLLVMGAATVVSLHLVVGLREWRRDGAASQKATPGWLDVGCVDEVRDSRAKVVCPPGQERVAVFRHGSCLSAVTNVCAHQRGPLGEGKIIDGCITCPWHGWEYRPENGQSPPPFQERIATYELRVVGRRILLNPQPLPPGTPVAPARIEE